MLSNCSCGIGEFKTIILMREFFFPLYCFIALLFYRTSYVFGHNGNFELFFFKNRFKILNSLSLSPSLSFFLFLSLNFHLDKVRLFDNFLNYKITYLILPHPFQAQQRYSQKDFLKQNSEII